MSNQVVISVENLGKLYLLNHQAERQRYLALRDVVANKFKGLLKTARAKTEKSTSREDFWALKNVDFEVKQGDILGIIGRNGAGKSTLLKILSRITEPSEGRVRIKGRIASLLEVGTGFHPELTGRENVFLNGAILGMSRAEVKRKFDEIVSFAEVEKFLDTAVKFYSSGMYVRLAFAVAAHLEPEILIIDEVLAVGDMAFQKKCLGRMGEVAKGGRTVIFVSHSMTTVTQLCSRGLMFDKGRVVMDGCVSEAAEAYFSVSSISSDGEFDLSEHPARSSESRPVMQKLRLCTDDGRSTTQLLPDSPCYIEIEYRSEQPLQYPRWAVAIEDCLGRRIMTYASYFQESQLEGISGEGMVRCSLGSLQLGTGRYLISVSVAEGRKGLVDSIDNAAWFEINWNNNFGNGEPYSSLYGPVLRQSEWRTTNAN